MLWTEKSNVNGSHTPQTGCEKLLLRMIHNFLSPRGLFRKLRLLADTHCKATCRWLACYWSHVVHMWCFILPRIVKANNSDQQEDKSTRNSTIKVNFCCTKVSVHDGTVIQSAASFELIIIHTRSVSMPAHLHCSTAWRLQTKAIYRSILLL